MYSPYFNFNQNNSMILYSARGDVTGDGIPDNVYLTGVKTPDSPFVQRITLLIQDGKTGMLNSVPLKSNAGYNPVLFLGDFTGNGVDEILISIASGGSGGIMYYYIYSYLMNVPNLLFDYNVFNESYQYSVTYKDDYKVEVINMTDNIRYIIDITYKGKDYLDEIYDSDGKLKDPIEGFVNPISGLYPVDFDANGVYELLVYQKVAGMYNADSLGYIQTILKWDRIEFQPTQQYMAIFGSTE